MPKAGEQKGWVARAVLRGRVIEEFSETTRERRWRVWRVMDACHPGSPELQKAEAI